MWRYTVLSFLLKLKTLLVKWFSVLHFVYKNNVFIREGTVSTTTVFEVNTKKRMYSFSFIFHTYFLFVKFIIVCRLKQTNKILLTVYKRQLYKFNCAFMFRGHLMPLFSSLSEALKQIKSYLRIITGKYTFIDFQYLNIL